MERSSEERSLGPRSGRMKSEAAEAKKASSEEGTRRRTRSTKAKAAEAKMAASSEVDEAAEAKMAASSEVDEANRRVLKLESEEDRKILMKVKSEEGKILKLKKEFVAASQAMLFDPEFDDPEFDNPPTVMAAQPVGKKKKKVLVKKLMTLAKPQIDLVKAMAVHPCPTRNLTEEQLAKRPQSFQDSYRQEIHLTNTRLAYLQALVDQQEKFGYAVDESEAEVTDSEGDDMVEAENY